MPTAIETIKQAWRAVLGHSPPPERAGDAGPPDPGVTTPPAEPPGPAPVPVPAANAAPAAAVDAGPAEPVEARAPIGGPALLPDGPDWLIFEPLPDTRRLSVGELLVFEGAALNETVKL